jgi:hypothetical protein
VVLEAVDIGAVRARTGGLLLSGQAGGTVEGALTWSATARRGNGRVEVPFVIEVDGGTLLGDRTEDRIAIGFYAYVIDPVGKVVDHIARGLILESADYSEKIAASGLKFVGRFDLEPGDYTLRVMVKNERGGEFFMSWSILTLASGDYPAPHLLPPLFPDPGGSWVLVRQGGEAVTISVDRATAILPCARPTLAENFPAEIYLGGGGWGSNAFVEIRILNELGRTVSEPVVRFTGPPSGDFEFRHAKLAPIDLPPGDYSLIVTLTDENTTEVLRRAVRMTVVGEGETRCWAGSGTTMPRPPMGSANRDSENAQKFSKKEIRAAYRSALRPLAEGDVVTARRLVAELERRTVATMHRSALQDLGEAELAEAKDLARVRPGTLMPVALLHRDLYRGYAARREGILSSHSRKMAVTLAEQLGRAKPYIGFPEALMVNFASDLAQAGSSSAARDLLERALRINPGFQPALLAFGFSFERAADYLEASEVYESLVDTHPHFDEGRLRLAINLIRTGRTDAGEELLRGLLGTGSRPWIQAVAVQELILLRARKEKQLAEA